MTSENRPANTTTRVTGRGRNLPRADKQVPKNNEQKVQNSTGRGEKGESETGKNIQTTWCAHTPHKHTPVHNNETPNTQINKAHKGITKVTGT